MPPSQDAVRSCGQRNQHERQWPQGVACHPPQSVESLVGYRQWVLKGLCLVYQSQAQLRAACHQLLATLKQVRVIHGLVPPLRRGRV